MAGIFGDAIKKFRKEGPLTFLSDSPSKLKTRLLVATIWDQVCQQPQPVWIDPNSIEYYLLSSTHTEKFSQKYRRDFPLHKLEKGKFPPAIFHGCVVPGNWDLMKKRIEYDRVHNAMFHRFTKEGNFESSEYNHILNQRNELRDDIDYRQDKLSRVDDLYHSIKEHGLLSPHQLADEEYNLENPGISVNIGRNGEFIFNNSGHHRLAISQVLKLRAIPVLVVVRHPIWQNIRESIKHSDEEYPGLTAKYSNHPDITSNST